MERSETSRYDFVQLCVLTKQSQSALMLLEVLVEPCRPDLVNLTQSGSGPVLQAVEVCGTLYSCMCGWRACAPACVIILLALPFDLLQKSLSGWYQLRSYKIFRFVFLLFSKPAKKWNMNMNIQVQQNGNTLTKWSIRNLEYLSAFISEQMNFPLQKFAIFMLVFRKSNNHCTLN